MKEVYELKVDVLNLKTTLTKVAKTKVWLNYIYGNNKNNLINIVNEYYDSPYLDSNFYRFYDKNGNAFYADIDNFQLYDENDFFKEIILENKNYLEIVYKKNENTILKDLKDWLGNGNESN